jgi:hypothetical protein
MKKEKMMGLNGNLSANYGYKDQQSANTTFNYRKNKLNFFIGADYNDNNYPSEIIARNNFTINNETNKSVSKVDQFNKHEQKTVRGGIDFDMNEKNAFSLSGSYGKQGYDNGSDATFWSKNYNTDTTFSTSRNFMDVKGNVIGANLDYSHKFNEKQKLSFSSNYSSWDGMDDYSVKVQNTDEYYHNGQVSKMLNYTKDNYNFQYRFNIDYNQPLWNGNFETGLQYRIEDRWDDLNYRNYNVDESVWIPNDSLSYHLDYTNTIYSVTPCIQIKC